MSSATSRLQATIDRAIERGGREALAVVGRDVAVAAVGAAGEEDDVRRQRLDGANILAGEAVGEGTDEFGAGAEGGLSRGFSGQLLDEADGDHAAGRRPPRTSRDDARK